MTLFVKDINNTVRVKLSETQKTDAADRLAKQHKAESRLVKGKFKNVEAPGTSLTFPYRKFPQDPLREYTFEDDHVYEIPVCVARHINITCNEKAHKYVVTPDGYKVPELFNRKSRYQFISMDLIE